MHNQSWLLFLMVIISAEDLKGIYICVVNTVNYFEIENLIRSLNIYQHNLKIKTNYHGAVI